MGSMKAKWSKDGAVGAVESKLGLEKGPGKAVEGSTDMLEVDV